MIETYGMVRGFWNTWKDLKINQYSLGFFVVDVDMIRFDLRN